MRSVADDATYLSLLEIGIYPCRTNACAPDYLQSQFIEVIPIDVLQFPDAIRHAHIELHRSPNSQSSP